ncbi:MAG: hypothetical protein PQJ59_16635 [Spirochaetales bacterium]|nr:hypothetical protein [Spirochaetales bacterium]
MKKKNRIICFDKEVTSLVIGTTVYRRVVKKGKETVWMKKYEEEKSRKTLNEKTNEVKDSLDEQLAKVGK